MISFKKSHFCFCALPPYHKHTHIYRNYLNILPFEKLTKMSIKEIYFIRIVKIIQYVSETAKIRATAMIIKNWPQSLFSIKN